VVRQNLTIDSLSAVRKGGNFIIKERGIKMKKVLSKFLVILFLMIVMAPILLTGCATGSGTEDNPFTPGQIAAIVVNALLIPLIGWGVTKVTAILDKRSHNEDLNRHFKTAINAIYTAVKEIMQIYVDALKKDGTWSEETQREAFKRARAKAIQLMGGVVLTALPEIVGNVDEWINSMIEAATQDVKIAKMNALPASAVPLPEGVV
jgi:hypothetical protein